MVEWTWCHCWVPLQGAIVVCDGWGGRVTTNFGGGHGGIAGCYGWVTANFGGVDVVPLQGAIVVCHGWGEGDDQLWGSGRGAIGGVDVAGCHCSVLWLVGRVTTNFGGVDVVPLLGAVVACYGGGGVTTNFGGVDMVPLITQKWVFAIWVYAGIMFLLQCSLLNVGMAAPLPPGGLAPQTAPGVKHCIVFRCSKPLSAVYHAKPTASR